MEAKAVVVFSWYVSFLLSSNISGNTPLPTLQGSCSPLQDENSLGQVLTVIYLHPTKRDITDMQIQYKTKAYALI